MCSNRVFLFPPILYLLGCTPATEKPHNNVPVTQDFHKNTYPLQYELQDIAKLTPIKHNFYRNKEGYLYQKTLGLRKIQGELKEIEYFNGLIPQEIDPFTFERLANSWYARDKNHIYLYRPVSGGMLITTVENVDNASFRVINYNYGADKNHYYHENSVIDKFIPQQTQEITNSHHEIIELKMGNLSYVLN